MRRAPPTVLVTGFEPFDGEVVNPSWLVAQALHGRTLAAGEGAHARVHAVQLPCVFAAALPALHAALAAVRPRLVMALGQASRPAVSVERVAVNLCDARIADNAGAAPVDVPVVAGAPAAYFSTLPVKAMVQAVRDAGIAVELSHSAGTFVCNQVFFGLMHALRRRRGVRGGFVHLPLLPEQAARRGLGAGMALATMTEAVQCALATALVTAIDLGHSEGRLD